MEGEKKTARTTAAIKGPSKRNGLKTRAGRKQGEAMLANKRVASFRGPEHFIALAPNQRVRDLFLPDKH